MRRMNIIAAAALLGGFQYDCAPLGEFYTVKTKNWRPQHPTAKRKNVKAARKQKHRRKP